MIPINARDPSSEWPTQNEDMRAAADIVDKYTLWNEGEPLGFLEVVVRKGEKEEKNKVELKMPEWIVELQSYFRDQYGYEHGHAITSKVLTRYLLKNEKVH